MSRIARGADDPLAVDRDRLGARQPQLLDQGPDVAGRHEVVALVAAGRRGVGDPRAGGRARSPSAATRPAAIRASLELGVQLLDEAPRALPLLERADLARAAPGSASLSSSCCAWRPSDGLDQRRPLLGRVADARPLGAKLGRDRGSRARGGRRRASPASSGPRAAARGEARSPCRPRSGWQVPRGRSPLPSRAGAAPTGARSPADDGQRRSRRAPRTERDRAVPAALPELPDRRRRRWPPRAAASRPGRAGAALARRRAAGPGPAVGQRARAAPAAARTGSPPSRRGLEPGGVEAGDVHAERRLERLVVGHAARVRPDERHEGVAPYVADEEVDRRDALRVGQRELLARRRELAGEAVERDQRAVADRAVDAIPRRSAS